MSEKENPFKKLVTYELSTPEFIKRLQSEGAEEGEKASLFCEVIGDPVPTIKWYTEEGVEITEDNDHYQMSYDLTTGRAELTIEKIHISDEMSYKCVASNEHGTAKTIGVMVIKNYKKKSKSPSPGRSLTPPTQSKRGVSPLKNIDVPVSNLLPVKEETEVSSESAADTKPIPTEEIFEGCKIISSLQDKLEVKEGDDFKICCNIIGNPEPEVLWFKDNHPLKDDFRIDIYSDRGNRFLEICDVKSSDAGEYTIFVRNSFNQVNARSKIIVLENPAKASRPNTQGLYEYNNRKETYRPPQFMTKPVDERIHEGNSLKIFAKVHGIPKPQISWFREGKPVKLDDMRLKVYENEGCNFFEVDNVSLLDAGEYTCTASNVMGAIFCSVVVSVEAMTEPESYSSEFHSDVEKSTEWGSVPEKSTDWGSVREKSTDWGSMREKSTDWGSAREKSENTEWGTVSDHFESEAESYRSKSDRRNKEIANNLVEKHVTEHIKRISSVDAHSEAEKETLLSEYKLLNDHKDEEREITLFKDDIVEIIDLSKPDKWLVKTKYSNIIQVCYVPPKQLERNESKIKLITEHQNRKTLAQRKLAQKVPKSEKILFGESSEQPKLSTICPTFDDSNTIYTKIGKNDEKYSSNTSLGSETVVNMPVTVPETSSTVATQLNESTTTRKVTEVTMFRSKKYDSSAKGMKVFESKNTESKSYEEKYLDTKMIESKKYETRDLSLKASERKSLETKSIEVNAKEVKDTLIEGEQCTTSQVRSMETKTKNIVDKTDKHSIELSSTLENKMNSLLNLSLPDLTAGTSKKAASYKKFFEFQNRRQISHESDLNNLDSSSSSEDLNKTMAEEADIYYASCDFTSTDLQNASATFLSLLENQFVEILDSQDSRYYLVRTRPRKDEKPKIGWIPACFLERKSNAVGQVNRRTTRELFRDDLFQMENKQQEATVKRNYSFNELIEMENAYVKDLQYIIESYLQEMSRLECPKQVKEKRDFIFSNIEDIFAFHKVLFLSQLMECGGEVDQMSRTFLKNRNNFELYVPYAVNRQFSESTLSSYETIRQFFDEINIKHNRIDNWVSDFLNKPLDRIVQYRQFVQEQIKYTVRAKQNSSMLQEAYFMFCDIFKIIETRQLINSIQHVPLELLSRLEKLNRFDAFYIVDSDNRLRERFLFLFKDSIIICRLKPRTTAETIAVNNSQLSSIVSGSVSLANYFKGALYFKAFIPLSSIKSIKMDNFDESDEKLLIEINMVQEEINEALSFVYNSSQRDPNELFENLFLNDNSRLLIQAKNPYSKLTFIKALKNNLICLGYLEETVDTLSFLHEDLIHNTITSITNNVMPRKRKHVSQKRRHQDKSNCCDQINESSIYTGSLTSLNKLARCQNDECCEDDCCCCDEYVEDGSVRRFLAKSPVTKTRYEEYSSHNDFPLVSCCSTSPQPTSDAYLSATSRVSRRSSRPNRLNTNDIISTDFYSFESTSENYQTADDEDTKPYFIKQLNSVSVYEGDSAILECRVGGNPEPILKWYRWDNTLIHDSPDFIYLKEANHTHKLIIRETIVQDAGAYKLVATNPHGQCVSTCKVFVKEDLTDQEETIIDNIEHYRSDNTDNDVFEEEYLHISESDGSPVLSSHEFESHSRTILLNQSRKPMTPVNEYQTKPKFLKLFESSTIKENSALLLTVQVFGEPIPDVSWHKDGREITSNNRVNITHGHNGASQLFIARALMDDAGIYQVTASNDHGISVYNGEINVEPSEDFANNVFQANYYNRNLSNVQNETYRNERHFEPERTPTGESIARLKCNVKEENVQVNWLKNESLINTSHGRYKQIDHGNERVLVVNDVQENDDGEYICQSGKYRVTLCLNLNEDTDIFRPTSSQVGDASDREDVELYFADDHFMKNRRQSTKLISPPQKFATTKDIYVNEGIRNAELKCRVLNDTTQVEWLRNEQPIENNRKYEICNRGNERILLIKEPTKVDDGDYVCQSGKHRVVLNLNVNPFNGGITPHMYSSEDDSVFVHNNMKTTGRDTELVFFDNQQATLKCQTINEDESVIWLKDNSYIPRNDKYVTINDGPFRILQINDLSKKDSGNYFCQSEKNKSSSIGFKLNVKEPEIEIFEPLRDIRVNNSNEKIVFEIVTQSPRSVNPSRVKWYKDGMEINETTDHRYTLFSYFNDNKADGAVLNFNKLVIDPPLSNQYDQGEYTCVINNDLRSSGHLYFDHAGNFKPEIANVKKSQLQGFQNLIKTPSENKTVVTQLNMTPLQGPSGNQVLPKNELAFVKEMEAFTECVEGHDCVLECVVNKFETRAQWYIENHQEPISMGNTKYEILNHDGRKHKLVIKKATPNDNALYTCRINDCLQTNTFVSVAEDVPLKIVGNLTDFHVPDLQKNLELSITTNKRIRNDKAHGTLIRWYMNKKEMKAGPEYEHLCVDNRIVLRYLRDVLFAKDNNAQIECRIQEIKMGLHNVELITKCRMIVDQLSQVGAFTKRLDDFVQHESGLHLDLEARVNFNAQLVKWFKNNAQIVNDQNYQLVDDPINRSYMLRLKCAKVKESGVYTIDVDGLQCSGEVKIVETPLKFIQPLQDQFFDLENDTSLTLDCQLNKPPAMFSIKPRWFKNDLEIIVTGTQVSKYDMIEEHNICALIIYDLDERDEGRYRCQVGNERTDCCIKPEYMLTKYLPNYIEQREGEVCMLSFAINRPPNGQFSMPITKWFKDSQEIADNPAKYRFTEKGNERTLTVLNCSPADSGLYKAYITDESTEPPTSLVTTNSCQVHIKKLKVEFVTPLDSVINIYEDDTVKLCCETVQENLKPRWFFNNQPVDQAVNQNKETYSTQTQHFLIINKAKQLTDSGDYTIRFGSDSQPSNSNCQVVVHKSTQSEGADSSRPEFLMHLNDVRCNEGEDFQLSGSIQRNFQSTDLIEWKKNGEFLVNSVGNTLNRFNDTMFADSEFELSCAGNTCTLEFKNARKHDAGQYELNIVELEPAPGMQPVVMKSKCQVHITSYTEKSEILRSIPRNVKLNEGETLTLECTFNKKPERVEWQRNSMKLLPIQSAAPNSSVNISANDEGKMQSLKITLCKPEHSGTYQINADDKIAICEVRVMPVVGQFVERPPQTIIFDCIKEMEDGNGTCTIECTVDKNSTVVKWFRGNQEIIPGQTVFKEKFEIVNEGPIRCLLIHDVNGDDSGEYFCSLGNDFATTTVNVIEAKPAVIDPKVNKVYEAKYEKIDVYEGKGLVMGIDLDSIEQSQRCSWFKNQLPLDLSTQHVISKIAESKKHTLKIDKLVLSDSGRYELIMSDATTGGVTLATIDLNVMKKPIAIVKKLNAKKVQNNLLLLECEVSQPITDQFKYAWFKEGQEITVDDQHLSRKVENTKCRLFINKFDYVDSGTYEFTIFDVASPELKEATSFRLEIKQNPFKSGMKVVNGDFNKTRTLRIEFETVHDKFEPADMKWLKDGCQLIFENNPKYVFAKSAPNKFSLEINDVDSTDNGAYSCGIDEFTNKLNLSGIENLENQAITEEVEEAVEELAEVIESISEAKKAQSSIIEDIKEMIDDKVDRSQVVTHTAEVVNKHGDSVNREISPILTQDAEKLVEPEQSYEAQIEEVISYVKPTAETHVEEELTVLEEKKLEPFMATESEVDLEALVEKPIMKKSESLVSLVEEVNVDSSSEVGEIKEDKPVEQQAKVTETIEEEDLSKKQKKKDKEPVQVKEVEEVNPEEKVEELPVDKTSEEKAKPQEEPKQELEEKKKPKDKEPVQVKEVEEVNPEEKAEELAPVEKAEEKAKPQEEPKQELEEKKKPKDKEPVQVKEVEEVNPEEKVEELPVDKTSEEKAKPQEEPKQELEEKKKPKDKEPVQVKEVEEVNPEEKAEELAPVEAEKPEKMDQSEVKDADLEKPEEVKEAKKDVDVLKSNWKPEIQTKEGELLSLELSMNGVIKPENIIIYKNGVKVKPSEYTVKKGKDESTEIKFTIKKAKDADAGAYKLCIKDGKDEKEVGASNITVKKPVTVSEPLKADKTNYTEGEDIKFTFSLNEPLVDKSKCIALTLGTKRVDEEHYEIIEETVSETVVTYTMLIKSCKLGKDDGAYKLQLLSKPGDAKSEFYTGKTDIKIVGKPIGVLNSEWSPETNAKVKEAVCLSVTIDKPLENTNDLVLTKDGKPVKITKDMVVLDNSDASCTIKLTLPTGSQTDAGIYKFVVKGKKTPDVELGQTKLNIQETAFKIAKTLSSDKTEYNVNDTITLTLVLSSKVDSVDKCICWTLNGKPLDSKTAKTSETKNQDGQFVYTLVIKDVQMKKHDGEYSVKIKQAITDKKELTDSVKVTIVEQAVTVLETNWKPETDIDADAKLELVVKIDKPIESTKDILLYKNAELVKLGSAYDVKLTNNTDGTCEVRLILKSGKPKDSGALKLCVKNERRDLLGSTELTVKPKKSEKEPIAVISSDWKPEITINESENLVLTAVVNRPLENLKEFSLLKENKKLLDSDAVKLSFTKKRVEDSDMCQITVTINESIPPDSGKYRLVHTDTNKTETELGVTQLTVAEIPLKVISDLSANKPEYLVGEEINLSFTLSKPLGDKDKCVNWKLNGKTIDMKSKQVSSHVEDKLAEGVVYTMKIKSCETDKNEGEYSVGLRAKASDAKSEFYSGKVSVKIVTEKFLLDSNWTPVVEMKEGENLVLFVELAKACNIKELVLLKDGKKLVETDAIKLSLENRNDDAGSERCVVKLNINEAIPPDSGKYRLVHVDAKKKETELGSSEIKVIEAPYEVLQPLKADKEKYKPNDDIVLSIKLSKPLVDKQKNVQLKLNGKSINITKDIVLTEDIDENLVTFYYFRVKTAKPGVNNGEYSLKLQSKINDVKSEFYSGSVTCEFEDDSGQFDFDGALTTSNTKPKEGESVKVTAKFNKPLDSSSHKIQWYLNNERADKSLRFIFSNPSELETSFEIKPMKLSDEAALIELALLKAKDNTELKRSKLKLEAPLKLLSDLRASKAKYEADEPVEISCELSALPANLCLLRNPKKSKEVFNITLEPAKEKQTIDVDTYSVHVTKTKDSYKVKIVNNKPDAAEDSDKYWIELNGDECSSNECKVEIKLSKLKFTNDITTPQASLVDSRDKVEIHFTLSRPKVALEEIKSDLQVILARNSSNKEDIYLSSNFELTVIPGSDDSVTTTFKLVMKEVVSENDSGKYSLKLKQSGEKSANSVEINVENNNFFITELPNELTVFEGETIKLSVKCTKIVTTSEWRKDDKKLNVKEDRYKRDKLVYAFEVKAAKLADSGIYEFKCQEGSGKGVSKCVVTVKEKPETLVKGLSDTVKVKEGETINLKVKFDREVNEKDLILFLNDNEFVASEHGTQVEVKLSRDATEYTVQIRGAQLNRDDGTYKLVSKNTESSCVVVVETKPLSFISQLEHCRLKVLPAVFYEKDPSLTEKYPRDAVFQCNLSSSCSEVQWFINDTLINEKIKDSARYNVSDVLGKAHTLTISNCVLLDTDSIVEIRVRDKKSHATLKVEMISMDQFIKVSMPLKDTRVQEKQDAEFECQVCVNPVLQQLDMEVLVRWQKDDKDLAEIEKYEYLDESDDQNNMKTQLKVVGVDKSDVGEYTVHFFILDTSTSSIIDLTKSNAKLIVQESKVSIVRGLPDTLVIKENEGFELNCELSKPGLKVKWTKDGKDLKNSKSIEITTYETSESNYAYKVKITPPSDAKDGAKYALSFEDLYTECKIVIQSTKPELGVKTPLANPIRVKEGDKATLSTEYTSSISTDTYRVEWFKNGKLLNFSSRSVKYKLQIVSAKCTLVISECSAEDEGAYEVKVFTGTDKDGLVQETSVELQAAAAVVLEGLNDVNVEEGDTAKLSFKASKSCMCEWYQFKDDPRRTLKNFTAKMVAAVRCEKVNADDRTVFSCKPVDVYGLTFHDAQVKDSCWYVAMLTADGVEAAGSDPLVFTCGRLNVKPQNIEILTKFADKQSVPEKDTITLKCRLSKALTASLAPRLRLFKNTDELILSSQFLNNEASTRYQLIDNASGQISIVIEQAKLEDAGLYSLKIDKLETKCQVTVEKIKKQITAPKIVKDLDTKPVEYSSNEPFAISITVTGEDLKSEWYRDNKKVVPVTNQIETVKIDENTYELRLNFATPFTSDSGKYYCKVSNSKGSATSKTLPIKVNDASKTEDLDESLFQTKPRFIEYFSDVYMEPGSEAQLKCKIIGKPDPKVVWSCNCAKITANEKFDLRNEGDHYTLIVRNIGANDEGEYTCKAVNAKGEASWSANLYLNESTKKRADLKLNAVGPNFLRKIKDSTVSEGSSAKFDCFIDGEPFPKVTWFKNNSPINTSDSSKYLVEIDEKTAKVALTIFKSDKTSDEGEYMVKLENSAGVSECSAFLAVESSAEDASKCRRKVRFSSPKDKDVYLIPTNEKQVPKPPGQPIIENYNTVNLLLKWPASPSDINNYNADNKDLESQSMLTYIIEYRTSKTYSWSVFASNIRELSTYVDCLYPGLVYSFRVRAENSCGISDCSPVVTTKNLKDDSNDKLEAPLTFKRDRVSVGKKPSITGEGKDIRYYVEGHTAEVSIEVNGYPTPTVKWVRFDECLKTDEETGVSIYTDSYHVHHMEISNACEKHEGLYQIVASNEYGQCVHDFYLQQADPPVFLEPYKDLTIENHHDVEMICKVDGIPYPEIKFYKDWHLLAESYRVRIKHIEPDTWVITIKGAIVRDSGLYTCTAKNIAGGTLCSCNLSVVDSLLNLPHPDLKTDLITFKRKVFAEDYELVEELGQSINSKIYRVIERRTAKEYLAKVAGTREYSEWIKTEADALNQVHQITDECFVRMHDAYETPNRRFILIFDEIKGKSVIEHMLTEQAGGARGGNHLEEHRAALHMKRVLECLQHLHSRNIVHLDVNAENIIMDTEAKKIKLIGFTHSKMLKPDVYTNSPKETVFHDYGQPEYVAPEIVLKRPITLNTDMWSIGVLTYQLLTGKSPFFGTTMKETLQNIVNCDWDQLSEDLGELSHDARDFIQSLFKSDPKDRLTVDQALGHPWIHNAIQQTNSCMLNRESLMQLHSRHIWMSQTKQKQPWLKTQRVSTLLDSVECNDTGISSGSSDSLNNRAVFEDAFSTTTNSSTTVTTKRSTKSVSKVTRFSSFDEQMYYEDDGVKIDYDEEELVPGTYLLPVRDPLFTVRVREYKRSRYEKLQSQERASSVYSKTGSVTRTSTTVTELSRAGSVAAISMRDVSKSFNGRTVKERYHIDVYGKCVQRGSLSRLNSLSHLRSSQSHQRSQSRASSIATDIIERPFKSFMDYKDDKRHIGGEGSCPIIREKLKDMFLIVGSIVTMRCRIEGNPAPRCFWYHNERLIIGDDDRFKIAQAEDGVITLSISKARVSDIGVYRCAARNRFGCTITNAKLTVGDTPDRPTRPIVSQFTSDQVYLIWESPNFNGNSDILCYKVDCKISGDVKWTNCLFTIEECCIIKSLQPDATYRFRVSCINTIGVSSYSWASEEVTMHNGNMVSKITIDHEQAEKLLMNQYNLEKRSQQLVLVRKLDEEMNSSRAKTLTDEVLNIRTSNPNELYTLEKIVVRFGGMRLVAASDKAHKTKRLIKFNVRKNENEIKILRGLREQDRLLELVEGFNFQENGRSTHAFVYSYAVPCMDFISIKHKYSEELVVKILRQLLDAVQWLHLHGFVHLNIHPMTIMNANYTQVNIKLGGLENAKQLAELDEPIGVGACAASVHSEILQPLEFSAPELLNKEPLSMATDIWNIGVFAALLLSGSSPFYDHNDQETTKANITFCRLTFDEFYDDVSGEAVLFIQQCLKRSPSNRLTLQECIDHKLFNLSVSNSRKRENILFLTEKLKSFSHEFGQRLGDN